MDYSAETAASVCDAVDVEIIQPSHSGIDGQDGDGENWSLVYEKFNKWYKVLKNDDVSTYEMIMSAMDIQHREVLLDGRFIYSRPPKQLKVKKRERMAEFSIPFNIALSSCAFKVVDKMVEDDIDLMKLDVGNANVIHVLIISASEKRHREDDYLKLLITVLKYLEAEEAQTILLQENSDGYRPLELAARLGIFGIFRELLNYPGYLVERSFEAGLNTYSVYNLTDYEGFGSRRRTIRSPLRLLAFAIPDGLESIKKYGITQLPVIEQWARLCLRRNLVFLALWWMLRITFICLMITVDFTVILRSKCQEIANASVAVVDVCGHLGKTSQSADIAYMLVSWSVIIVLMDIIEVIVVCFDRDRRLAYKGITNPFRDFIAWTAFYRFCQFVLVFLAASTPAVTSVYEGEQAFNVMLIMKACSLPFIMMSILYVVEPLPLLGLFAVTLQRMIESIIAFIVFLVPMILTFARFFQVITNSKFGFHTTGDSMYRLFLLETGTFDFGQDPSLVIQLVHVTYYIMSGILLMNYLIAVMTNVATDSDDDREVLIFLRRLNCTVLADERYGSWFWKLFYKLYGTKSLYVYAEEDD